MRLDLWNIGDDANFRSWLDSDLTATPDLRPLYPQEPAFPVPPPTSEGDPEATFAALDRLTNWVNL